VEPDDLIFSGCHGLSVRALRLYRTREGGVVLNLTMEMDHDPVKITGSGNAFLSRDATGSEGAGTSSAGNGRQNTPRQCVREGASTSHGENYPDQNPGL